MYQLQHTGDEWRNNRRVIAPRKSILRLFWPKPKIDIFSQIS